MPQHMASLAGERLYLTNVQYSEDKKEVLVEFSNERSKVCERFSFFPFTVLSSKHDSVKLSSLLLDLGIKGFEVSVCDNGTFFGKTIIRASSFNELKRVSNALASVLEEKPLVLEPERSFLLEKNWSYFDSFNYDKFPQKILDSSLSEKDLGFFITKALPFSQALSLSEKETLFLVELSALSNLLCVPMSKVPNGLNERTELFLENIFFRNGSQVSWGKGKEFFVCQEYAPLGFFDSVSSIDFSFVWSQLFSKDFFNLSPESSNCSCCSPIALSNKNLFPSSLIEVQFLQDNFFFESSSHSFALSFHKNNSFKDNRLAKKKEFFLKSFPVGPFFRNDKALVPLEDAKRLLSDEKVSLGSKDKHELNWFCLKEEGFLSREISFFTQSLSSFNSFLNSFQSGLFVVKPFSFFFVSAQLSSLNSLLSELPFQLMNVNSKFFSLPLARNILSVQEATMHKFREFSENNGYRVLHSDNRSAFVKGFSSLRLAKRFAKASSLPQPQIRAFSKQTKISQM